jgi:hypothetical protein
MFEKTPMQTKALSAYLTTRFKSLASCLTLLGQNPEHLDNPTIPDDVVGRIARLMDLTPDKLRVLVAPFEQR